MKRHTGISRLAAAVLAAAVLTGAPPAKAAERERTIPVTTGISVYLDGAKLTLTDTMGARVKAFASGGTTYVPVRAISKALDLKVGWSEATGTVSISGTPRNIVGQTGIPNVAGTAGTQTIPVTGGLTIMMNGKKLTPTDVNGKVVDVFASNGTTYLPVRAVTTALGLGVEWDGGTRSAYLTTDDGTAADTTASSAPKIPVMDGGLGPVNIRKNTVVDIDGTPYFDLGDHGHTSVGANGKVIPFDVYYGVELTAGQNAVALRWHNYTDEDVRPTTVGIKSGYHGTSQAMADLVEGEGEAYTISTENLANGPYQLTVSWSNSAQTPIWFYKNGEENYYCKTSSKSVDDMLAWYNRKIDINKLISSWGYTPQNSLDDSDQIWAYPVLAERDQSKYRCDNQRWRDLADQLVPDKSVPDDQKAVVIHDWMVWSLAYDHYKCDVLGSTRAKYYGDYTGRYSMWDTHVGVCADFATVYCIMLRHVGVPTMSLEYNNKHVWNLVYMDGQWVEIDVTGDMCDHVYGADVNDVVCDQRYTYGYFGTPFDTGGITGNHHINYGMYTYKFMTGAGQY